MKRYLLTIVTALTCMGSVAIAETVAPESVKIEDGAIVNSLTGVAGNAETGREVFADRKLGNCLACHQNNDLKELSFHGEVGPEMNGVADRWDAAQLRAIIVNSKVIFGDQTIMPAFYFNHDETGFRIAEKFQGKTILSAQDVEDIVAYLQTLKEE